MLYTLCSYVQCAAAASPNAEAVKSERGKKNEKPSGEPCRVAIYCRSIPQELQQSGNGSICVLYCFMRVALAMWLFWVPVFSIVPPTTAATFHR